MDKEELWVFKYAPKTLDEMVISEEKKSVLQKVLDELPNTLIAGKPGTGKGTFMEILKKQTGFNVLKINGSMETGIDSIREKVKKFSTGFNPSGKNIVYINEADRLSPQAMDSLKDLSETVQHITRFFFLSNDETLRNDIEGAIKSRCSYHVNLNDPPGKEILLKCLRICKQEGVQIESKKEIVNLIKKCYPDIRKIIGTLQANVVDGRIGQISFSTDHDLYKSIFDLMRQSDIDEVRKKLKSNFINYGDLFNFIYNEVMDNMSSDNGEQLIDNPAEFILLSGQYLHKNEIVAIKEINFMAYFLDLMKHGVI